jgi:acetolactate synthase-1/2/3 large subunit
MRAIESVLRFLCKNGVKHIFGIPAGSINALYDALNDIPDIVPIVAKHETSAGYMATAYTRITGTPSVCVGSSGPGATNLVTPAANAFIEKLPVIFISGAVPSTKFGKGGAQELIAEQIFASITKSSKTILDPNKLQEEISNSFQIAISDVPGPVHLAIPIDIQMAEVGNPYFPSISQIKFTDFDKLSVRRAAKLIYDTGSRGALLLGHGSKKACREILEFAELTGWPVATTPRGKGAFPENHSLSLGVYGLSGNLKAIHSLNQNEHDLLIVVGSSLGELSTGNWEKNLTLGKKMIHIDIDTAEFNKNYMADIRICGDAADVIKQLLIYLLEMGIPQRLNVNRQFNNAIEQNKASAASNRPVPMKANLNEWSTKHAIQQIGACASDNTRFYIDIGEFMTYAIQNLTIIEEQEFDIDINFGGMGSGIGGAIGAKLAEPQRPVVCITGDGCFFMHGMEILVAKEYNLPIVFFVINNARLGMVYHGHMLQYKRCLSEFSQSRINLFSVVESFGIRTAQINSLAELQPEHLWEWQHCGEPVVVEVVVDGNEVPPMGERVKFLEGATY